MCATVAGPTYLGDDDLLGREGLLQPMVLLQRKIDRGLHRYAFPVGKQVDTDEVAMLGELRMREPDVPRFRGAHWLTDGRARPIEVTLEHLDGHIALQYDFVAHEDAHHVQM